MEMDLQNIAVDASNSTKPTIFQVPDSVCKEKPEVFTPKVISLGPYHNGKSHLQALKSEKEQALANFLQKGGKPLRDYVRALEKVVRTLQNSYLDLDDKWKNQPGEFIQLMIEDGSFMLEIMRSNRKAHAPNDPLFCSNALQCKIPYIRRDMLIIENQLPLLLLKELITTEKNVDEKAAEAEITELMIRFFMPSIHVDQATFKDFTKTMNCLHALDLYFQRKIFIPLKVHEVWKQKQLPLSPSFNFVGMRPATALQEAGVIFGRSISPALTSIHFDSRRGVLTLPFTTIDNTSESEFLNMVVLEECIHFSNEVSSYVVFMNALLDSAQDVQLLKKHQLLYNGVGSDNDVVSLFSSMRKEVNVDQGGSFGGIQAEVEKYCSNRSWNSMWANLKHTYFKNLWSSVSISVRVFVVLLTIASTILEWLKK